MSLLYLLDTNIASCYLRRTSACLEQRVNAVADVSRLIRAVEAGEERGKTRPRTRLTLAFRPSRC